MKDECRKVLDVRGSCRGSGSVAVLGDRSGSLALIATVTERTI